METGQREGRWEKGKGTKRGENPRERKDSMSKGGERQGRKEAITRGRQQLLGRRECCQGERGEG